MRNVVTTFLELAGAACVIAGVWAVFWPAGLVALGVALLAAGFVGER